MSFRPDVFLYDTTLRDGTQRENISLSCDDKLKIARRLDAFGIPYIEGGWPGSNPKDAEFFERAHHEDFEQARICAFGSTRRKNTPVARDGNIQALLAAQTPVVTLVGKSWRLHVEAVLETTPDENCRMIAESVRFFKDVDREVVYDAEHFFDGYLDDPDHALDTLRAAQEGGADFVTLCDTNGGTLPWQIEEITAHVARELPEVQLGIHTHDDAGCGVANSLAAVRAGATMVQGTINGYGERVANANLTTILPDLQLKMECRCVEPEQLRQLASLSRFVAETANLKHDDHFPYVGRSAFAHKGGIHVAAILKDASSYQHIEPEDVGNEMRTVVSELSGRGNIVHLAQRRGLDPEGVHVREVLQSVKDLESRGYTFEGAEASVELKLLRTSKDYEPPFQILDFLVVAEQRDGLGERNEATVKVRIGNSVEHTAAEGNGPVNALARALRKALVPHHPHLEDLHLADYKVRILDSSEGTAATTRVLIDFRYDGVTFTTVGASANIIEASYEAIADAFEVVLGGLADGT